MKQPHTHLLRAATLALLAACSGDGGTGPSPTPVPPVQPDRVAFTGVNGLTPGGTATLSGNHLDLLKELSVDGAAVTYTIASSTQATFAVPADFGRACETDGRPISVAGTDNASFQAVLELRDTIALAPGESRVLSGSQLTGDCIRIGAHDGDYMVTALNPSTEPVERPDALVSVRTWTESSAPATNVASLTSATQHTRFDAYVPRPLHATAPGSDPFSANPTPFDPAYATAGVGDTVTFIALGQGTLDPCTASRNQLTTYRAEIAAISGNTVIAVDLRLPNAAQHLAPASKQVLAEIARTVDPAIEPTMREVFGTSYRRLAGGGGRFYTVVTDTKGVVATAIAAITGDAKSDCPNSSEMITAGLSGTTVRNPSHVPNNAASLVHEYAHSADFIAAKRAGFGFGSTGWSVEAWAETTALAAHDKASYAVGNTSTRNAFWAQFPARSPWTGLGRYSHGSALLAWARQQSGETTNPAKQGTVYRTLLGHYDEPIQRQLDRIANAAGTKRADLLDAYATASAAAGLTTAPGIPHFTAFQLTLPPSIPAAKTASRTSNTLRTLAASPGSYDAVYLLTQTGKGVSLTLTDAATTAGSIRLTRLR
jgi:hypothetical protein